MCVCMSFFLRWIDNNKYDINRCQILCFFSFHYHGMALIRLKNGKLDFKTFRGYIIRRILPELKKVCFMCRTVI